MNEQDGLYTVLSRGIGPDGQPLSQARVVAAVCEELDCNANWPMVLDLAERPEIEVILSNTTETGIVFDPEVSADDAPPASFPAKLTALLAHRWRSLGPDAPGWQIIPCELTDRSGDALAELVRRHVLAWNLPDAFTDWLGRSVVFYNTLVDRIVPGAPKADRDAIEAGLGYHDACLTTAELFHFLTIEQRSGQPPPLLRLDRFDPGTVLVPDVTPLKLRKVAILNGAHTALCPLAILADIPTVGQAMDLPEGRRFVEEFLAAEVLPFLDLPPEETRAFADEVLRRFTNPFVQHLWHDISLNALAKIRARNLDRMLAYMARHDQPPPCLTLSLAAWCLFYTGRFPAAASLPARDTPEVLAIFAGLGTLATPLELASTVLEETRFWGRSIATPILTAALTDAIARLDLALRKGADLPSLLAQR